MGLIGAFGRHFAMKRSSKCWNPALFLALRSILLGRFSIPVKEEDFFARDYGQETRRRYAPKKMGRVNCSVAVLAILVLLELLQILECDILIIEEVDFKFEQQCRRLCFFEKF